MTLLYEMDKYDYYCLHQNLHVQRAKNYIPSQEEPTNMIELFKYNALEAGWTDRFVNELLAIKTKNRLLVLDFRRMTYSPTHSIVKLKSVLTNSNYQGISFVSDDDKVSALIKEAIQEWTKEDDGLTASLDNPFLFCGDNQCFGELKELIGDESLGSAVNRDINRYIFNELRCEESQNEIRIESSNVYTNRYFDVKKAFVDGALNNLIVYRLANTLVLLDQVDFDAFICASLTGAAITSGLAALFHKPMIFMKNIGPQMSASDERIMERIRKDKKYIYVYDFMCLGTEYERLRMICNIRKAKIVYSVGVSYFRMPSFETAETDGGYMFDNSARLKIASLFHINAFEPGYYKCSVERRNSNEH